MKIIRFETFTVSVPYAFPETSTRVYRRGLTNIIVKLTADNGLVGWGESYGGADAPSMEQVLAAAQPFVLGRDPWQSDAIAHEYFLRGLYHRSMTAHFAFAGIDQALWDLCGKECGQPLYRLFGGAMRDEVNYFYYLTPRVAEGGTDAVERACAEGVRRGYTCFYAKVGSDSKAEADMLAAIRRAIGPDRKIRIDANEGWCVSEAVKLLAAWNEAYSIDFCEGPVRAKPVENMRDLRQRVHVAICANEGLWGPADALRMITSHSADVLCFSSYWVGSLRRFLTLSHLAHLEGIGVVKHTHGELGIGAAAMHHAMLTIPNAWEGSQELTSLLQDDIVKSPLPIATGPTWGRIERPGLGIDVDEEKLAQYHEAYLRDGQFLSYRTEQLSDDIRERIERMRLDTA